MNDQPAQWDATTERLIAFARRANFELLSGEAVHETKRHLIDTSYQSNSSATFDSDPLRYDKALLTQWLRSEFPKN